MMWLRKSKKGFTLVELMVVVAIIGILALLGLRLFLMQQVRAKNAIVKANAATIHTIIQGNLADRGFTSTELAVNAICQADGITELTGGVGTNIDRPAGMKNPHNSSVVAATPGIVVIEDATGFAEAADFAAAYALGTALDDTEAGEVKVGMDSDVDEPNKFYIIPLDHNGEILGEVYIAQK